jgi:hypothetical protein
MTAVVVLMVGLWVVGGPHSLAADKGDKKKPSKPAATEPKGGVFDDLPEGEADKEEMTEDEKESTNEESEGFGAGRSGGKKKPTKTETKVSVEDKEKAKYVRTVQRRFTEKQAVYLLRTIEQGYEKSNDPQKAGPDGYAPYERVSFELCEGQEEGVAFVLEFMTKFGVPWEKKAKGSSRKKKEKESAGIPERPQPVRDWEIVDMFPDKLSAEAARDQYLNQQEQIEQLREQQRQQQGQ